MIVLLLILALVASCISTEVTGIEPITAPAIDTTTKSKSHEPPKPPKDTTDQDGRVPITFNPSVEDWEEQDINI